MPDLKVVTFAPDWGLPTIGPFGLKLLGWLNRARLRYEHAFEINSFKGPKGKSPWAVIDGVPVGDSGRIIRQLVAATGFDIDAGLSPGQRAEGHLVVRALEEGFHQVLEWELCVHPAGVEAFDAMVATAMPPVVAPMAGRWVRRHFRRQLHARGIARFSETEIAAIGRADVDAVAARLADRPYLLGDRMAMADLAVFGQLAPMARWPMSTPVADHIKAQRPVMDFVGRVQAACFGNGSAARAA